MADLSSRDVERANFAFSIYDLDGSGSVDAYYLGDVLRGLNLNPTNATVEKLGGTKKKGEKMMKVEEFLPIFSQCKKDKDQGVYEDFLECLKLYDKQENGMMLQAELSHTLLSLGERLTDAEVEEVMKDCSPPEDDEGFIQYDRGKMQYCTNTYPYRRTSVGLPHTAMLSMGIPTKLSPDPPPVNHAYKIP